MGVMSSGSELSISLQSDIPTEGCRAGILNTVLQKGSGPAARGGQRLEMVPWAWDTSVPIPQTTASSEILTEVLL